MTDPDSISCIKKNGFSLVELSIVLVIIALVTGGILSGKTLIHASELRSITSERDKFVTAVGAFQGKYLALPGDMPNATQFWGAMQPSNPSCNYYYNDPTGGAYDVDNPPLTLPSGSSADTKTCNGNGDRHIDFSASYGLGRSGGDDPIDIDLKYEAAVFWKELGNAGLISGTYNGTYGTLTNSSDSSHPFPSTTDGSASSPSGKIPQSSWGVQYSDTTGNSLYYMKGQQFTDFNLLTGEDVLNVDSKIDDGAPATGKVHPATADTSVPAPCTTSGGTSYDATSTVKNCGIEFSNQF